MYRTTRRFRLGVATLLIAAPLCEVAEASLSPLTDGTTAQDLQAVAAHQSAFTGSVLIGILGTILYVPAFAGLARLTWERSRKLSAIAGAIAVLSMLGFMGVRMMQAVELQTVRGPLGAGQAASLIDGAGSNPLGGVFLALFLGGSVIGVPLLAVAVWRARLAPIPAAVLFLAFPFVDLLTPGHLGTVVSHLVLLAGLGWIALSVARVPAPTGQALRGREAVPSA